MSLTSALNYQTPKRKVQRTYSLAYTLAKMNALANQKSASIKDQTITTNQPDLNGQVNKKRIK